jgi:hypothetical protein
MTSSKVEHTMNGRPRRNIASTAPAEEYFCPYSSRIIRVENGTHSAQIQTRASPSARILLAERTPSRLLITDTRGISTSLNDAVATEAGCTIFDAEEYSAEATGFAIAPTIETSRN